MNFIWTDLQTQEVFEISLPVEWYMEAEKDEQFLEWAKGRIIRRGNVNGWNSEKTYMG